MSAGITVVLHCSSNRHTKFSCAVKFKAKSRTCAILQKICTTEMVSSTSLVHSTDIHYAYDAGTGFSILNVDEQGIDLTNCLCPSALARGVQHFGYPL